MACPTSATSPCPVHGSCPFLASLGCVLYLPPTTRCFPGKSFTVSPRPLAKLCVRRLSHVWSDICVSLPRVKWHLHFTHVLFPSASGAWQGRRSPQRACSSPGACWAAEHDLFCLLLASGFISLDKRHINARCSSLH